eukprot:GHVU01192641.1.p3 GENE.GHVU01192641.1~~GHVU01192641.1.p3  ORF type:complete len:121 (+),score=17.08 GHVU01192641.1:269-631(+)
MRGKQPKVLTGTAALIDSLIPRPGNTQARSQDERDRTADTEACMDRRTEGRGEACTHRGGCGGDDVITAVSFLTTLCVHSPPNICVMFFGSRSTLMTWRSAEPTIDCGAEERKEMWQRRR